MTSIEKVVVHPLVLLSVVDHYSRIDKVSSQRRVVGCLLGSCRKGILDVSNSFAVPFDEDEKDADVYFMDHDYLEAMYAMFKKVNAKEKVIGWYSTGPKIRASDIEINELMRRYTTEPILCIIDVNPKDDLEIPTQAYISIENAPEAKSVSRRTFSHIESDIGAEEAEEVGVEHLLRNIRDTSLSTVSGQVQTKLASLYSLKNRMQDLCTYLDNVIKGKTPPNHQIIYNLQDILNLCPDLKNKDLEKSIAVTNNDNMLVIYLSSLVRSILALDNLIENKLTNKGANKEGDDDEKESKKEEDSKDTEAKKEGEKKK